MEVWRLILVERRQDVVLIYARQRSAGRLG